jgi:uncharacterized protein (DUF1684 family)
MIIRASKCLLFLLVVCTVSAQSSFQVENRQWRQAREAELKAEDGWLTVSGLFWLKEGPNTLGTGSNQRIILPKDSAPASVGTLELANGMVTLKVAPGVSVMVINKTVAELEMRFEDDKQPPPFTVGSLKLSVIKRGDRYGLRVRDKNSPARRVFKGLRWFPARESYRVTASFVPDDQPKEIIIMNVLGDELKMKSPGTLSFELHGKTYQLRPVVEDDKKLFILFKDRTAGKTTYGAGRFLYADLPKDGKVVLDFNRAENPPCAFTLYATCPLPPRQNFLPIAIDAGEMEFHLTIRK